MDCAAEEQLVRMALAEVPSVRGLGFDLAHRRVSVVHEGGSEPVIAALSTLGLSARVDAGAQAVPTVGNVQERPVLIAVLVINATMFVVELVAGVVAGSLELIADSLDMLADASVYGIALAAVGGAAAARRRSARVSGWLQLGLAGLVLIEVVRRAVSGGEPVSAVMIGVGALALAANTTALLLLARHRSGGLHMRASWIFTANDTLVNLGVILAGGLVVVTGRQWPDLVIGVLIAVLVASGSWRILRMTRRPR
jgi:Co/Zn/Cd efflux system component